MEFRSELLGSSVPVQVDGSSDTLVVLAHGAGGSMEAKTVLRLRDILLSVGCSVARFNFLYKEQAKNLPDKMPVLMETYSQVVADLRTRVQPTRVICGGHSMGGRTASMMAADGFAMDGLLLFGYPLHPAGKPEKLRDEHLPRIACPSLCFNGTEDELCTVELMDAVLPRLQETWTMHWLKAADHSLNTRKKASGRGNGDIDDEIREVLQGWLPTVGAEAA